MNTPLNKHTTIPVLKRGRRKYKSPSPNLLSGSILKKLMENGFFYSLTPTHCLIFFPLISPSKRHYGATSRRCLPSSLTGHVSSRSQSKPAAGAAQGSAGGQRETSPQKLSLETLWLAISGQRAQSRHNKKILILWLKKYNSAACPLHVLLWKWSLSKTCW